jgi:hypothetical protein
VYSNLSFDGLDDNIFPTEFKGRDTVDLSDTKNLRKLWSKLSDNPEIQFSPVAPVKTGIESIIPKSFLKTEDKEIDAVFEARVNEIVEKRMAEERIDFGQVQQYLAEQNGWEISEEERILTNEEIYNAKK